MMCMHTRFSTKSRFRVRRDYLVNILFDVEQILPKSIYVDIEERVTTDHWVAVVHTSHSRRLDIGQSRYSVTQNSGQLDPPQLPNLTVVEGCGPGGFFVLIPEPISKLERFKLLG